MRKGITLVPVMVFPFFTVSIVASREGEWKWFVAGTRSNTADTGSSSGAS